MNMLTKKAFTAARRIIETMGRPLEIARFRHVFEGASANVVLETLGRHQNPDGGFGHALEPDLRADESSALCTSVAFQILRSIQAPLEEAHVLAGIAHLLQTFDRDRVYWRIIPKSAERSPHAPWWNQDGDSEAFDAFSLNPTAEILGYLCDYQKIVPNDIFLLVSERVVSHLSGLEKIEMHELLCCVRLLQTRTLPGDTYDRICEKVVQLTAATVERDPAKWKGYSLRPVQIVDGPGSAFMAGLEEVVAANLDFEIASQNEDGSWWPTWTWGGAFPDDWERARREWTGILTLEKLLLLKRFDRIDGIA